MVSLPKYHFLIPYHIESLRQVDGGDTCLQVKRLYQAAIHRVDVHMLRCLAADIERSLLGVEQEAAFCLVDALRLVAAAALAAMRLGVRQCAGARLFLGIVGGRVGLGFGLCGLLGLRHIGAEGGNCACATYVIFVVAGIESTHGKC